MGKPGRLAQRSFRRWTGLIMPTSHDLHSPRKEADVIYVSAKQLEQVEYLIHQSLNGNHILFDPELVRRTFHYGFAHSSTESSLTSDEAYAVEHHIEKLILQPGLEAKRAYLEKLDAEVLEKVIRTYFHIVENNLFESSDVRH